MALISEVIPPLTAAFPRFASAAPTALSLPLSLPSSSSSCCLPSLLVHFHPHCPSLRPNSPFYSLPLSSWCKVLTVMLLWRRQDNGGRPQKLFSISGVTVWVPWSERTRRSRFRLESAEGAWPLYTSKSLPLIQLADFFFCIIAIAAKRRAKNIILIHLLNGALVAEWLNIFKEPEKHCLAGYLRNVYPYDGSHVR